MRIAPEGYSLIIPTLILSALFWVLSFLVGEIALGLSLLSVILTVGLIFFFRDPIRIPPVGENLILSSADGLVLPLGKYQDENGAEYRMLSIFLSLFNVHVNRSAVTGKVVEVEHRAGKFLIASRKEASSVNEMNRITIDCLKGRIVMQQVTGIIARRVVCNLSAGQEVIAGQRIGIMKFGSRMDLILPANVEIKVKSGDKVTAGISVIGEWK